MLNARMFAPVKRPWGSAVIAVVLIAFGTVVAAASGAKLRADLVGTYAGADIRLLFPIGFGVAIVALGVAMLRTLGPMLRSKAG